MRVVYWAHLQLAKRQIIEALQAVPGAELTVVETLPELLGALERAEALVLANAPPQQAREVVKAVSAPGSSVRWMHFITAGREGFEEAGLPQHIPVTDPAGAVAPTVAEHGMALLLALARRVPAMLEQQSRRNWSRPAVSGQARSLEAGLLAIVGYGRIGREVARRARAFGMRTVGISRSSGTDEFLDESYGLADLESVLSRADAVVVSIALTGNTQHLFDRRRFAACRRGALFVNVARGGLVDQVALAEALASGQLGGAGLDVVDPEPLPESDPLWQAPNLIISPHFAGGGSPASLARLANGAAANLKRLMAGEPLDHVVN